MHAVRRRDLLHFHRSKLLRNMPALSRRDLLRVPRIHQLHGLFRGDLLHRGGGQFLDSLYVLRSRIVLLHGDKHLRAVRRGDLHCRGRDDWGVYPLSRRQFWVECQLYNVHPVCRRKLLLSRFFCMHPVHSGQLCPQRQLEFVLPPVRSRELLLSGGIYMHVMCRRDLLHFRRRNFVCDMHALPCRQLLRLPRIHQLHGLPRWNRLHCVWRQLVNGLHGLSSRDEHPPSGSPYCVGRNGACGAACRGAEILLLCLHHYWIL